MTFCKVWVNDAGELCAEVVGEEEAEVYRQAHECQSDKATVDHFGGPLTVADPRAVSPSVPVFDEEARLSDHLRMESEAHAYRDGLAAGLKPEQSGYSIPAAYGEVWLKGYKDGRTSEGVALPGASSITEWGRSVIGRVLDNAQGFHPMSGTAPPVALSTDTKTHEAMPATAFKRWDDGHP